MQHWPHPPFYAYGPGFQAWALSFVVLLAAWARRPKWRRPAIDRWSWCVLGLFVLAAALRFYRVTTVPFALHFDEVMDFFVLEGMRHGVVENIFSRVDTVPPQPGLVAGLDWLLGFFTSNWFAAQRYASATFGTLSIATTYLLARRLWSRAVAVVATFALTFSYWQLISSRFQSFFPGPPFAAALMWWLVLRAVDGGVLEGVVAGIFIGLGLMLYDPIKVMLVALPCWLLWHVAVSRGFARRTMLQVVVTGAVAAMVLTPLLRRNGWGGYFRRADQVTVLGGDFRARLLPAGSDVLKVATLQLTRLALIVNGGAEVAANHHSDLPLLNWAELALAGLGLLICCRHWRSSKGSIVPIWLFLTVAGVSVSTVPEASYRLLVALPALAVLIGIGAVTTFTILRDRLNARPATFLLFVAGISLAAYDIRINATRSLQYFVAMNRAIDMTILARAIAREPEQTRYYVEATPNQTGHITFLALTHTHPVTTVANLIDQVPRLVDPYEPVVFAIPSWAGNYSLRYVQRLYPDAKTDPVADPSGRVGGYLVRVPAGAVPHPRPSTCGLERTACDGHIHAVDPYVMFLDLRHLCLSQPTPRVEWRGSVEIPDSPLELGVTQSYMTSSIFLDGQLVITTTESGQSVAPICLRPGTHALAIVADVLDGAPTTLQLWWRPPRAAGDIIPCHALTPASWSTGEPAGQGGVPF